jgi:hypothetical protein
MISVPVGIIRKTLLTLAILAAPRTLLAVGLESEILSKDNCLADCLSGQPMTNPSNDGEDVQKLIQTLGLAYENSLRHDKPNADLEVMDLRLEGASIRFASRIFHEITRGSCQAGEFADTTKVTADGPCVLDDKSVAIRDLSDTLSNAAYRLENLARSAPDTDGPNAQRALHLARMRSMEHLYRMVFAFSKIYLDRSQSGTYLDAAQEQLKLARQQMELERSLCTCNTSGYAVRLGELSQLDDRLKETGRSTTQP